MDKKTTWIGVVFAVSLGLIFFSILLLNKSLYDTILSILLNGNEYTIHYLVNDASYKTYKQLYPNFSILVYLLIFIKKIFLFLLLGIAISFVWYFYSKKIINKNYIFYFFISTILFFSLEITLSVIDYKNIIQLKWNGREIGHNLELKQQQGVDSNGIIYFLKETENYIPKYHINEFGFRSNYNFDSLTIQTIKDTSIVIMFVGDSHTEGCCAEPIQKSFVDLIDKEKGITALNFGVGATDPLQYKLVVDKYLSKIKPNILVIPFCLGNDFMWQDRKPSTKFPLCFQTNFNWLDTRLPLSHPNYQPDTYFDSWEQAREFYIEWYTISGAKRTLFEKSIVEPSNLFCFLYYTPLGIKKSITILKNNNKYQIYNRLNLSQISYKYIDDIKKKCDSLNVQFVLVGVPTIRDMGKNMSEVNQEYQNRLHDIPIAIPTNIYKEDFVSYENDHFVNSGHQKFAKFIMEKLKKTME